MGHQTRCQCQSMAISQIESEMKELCSRSRGSTINAMVIIDFKMKYEVKSSRESTLEHYGKRGLGWHGMAIIFYLFDDTESAPYKNIVYIDQIMNDSNVQDSATVCGMLEIGIEAIIKELPFIKEAVLVSDNASSYQNHIVTMMVGMFNNKFYDQFFISAIVHSETQYGKTLLDAHFATTNRHLINFMKTWRQNRVTKINSPRGLAWALSFNNGVKNSMIQLVNFNRQRLDEILKIFQSATTKCSEYYSRANYIGFKRPTVEERMDTTKNYIELVKAARLQWKVRAFSNIKPSVQFKVDMTTSDLVKVDKKTQTLIIDILEREYVTTDERSVRTTSTVNKKKGRDKNNGSKTTIEVFDSDSDYDDMPMKKIRDSNATEEEDNFDFSFYRYSRKSKSNMLDKLEAVGAMTLLGLSRNTEICSNTSDGDEDDDSDYNYDDDDSDCSDDDDDHVLDKYFLSSNNFRTYGDPKTDYFETDKSLTGTTVLKFQPIGSLRNKKNKSKKQASISHRHMLKGAVEQAVKIAKQSILDSSHFKNRNELDPIVDEASQFKMEPFDSGWARRGRRGAIYGESYISLYEKELAEMFQMGVEYSYNKMSAGKMREHLQTSHPESFSIPGETEIKQFINKLSEQMKRNQSVDPRKPKSTRGRKPGNTKVTWHAKLKNILEQNYKEKPRVIYNIFINSYDGKFPHDLPTKENGDPDDTKIKQALQRIRRNIESKVQKNVLM